MTLRAFLRGGELLEARPPATPRRLEKCPSSIFARRRSPHGRFERRFAVDSRLAHLADAACALQWPSGANYTVPPPCLEGHAKRFRAGTSGGDGSFNGKVQWESCSG